MKRKLFLSLAALLCVVFALISGKTANGASEQDTPPPPPAAFRIALVSDPHTTRGTKEDQPLYRGRFEKVIAEVNAAKVDMVLVAGDLTQSGNPEEIADFTALAQGFTAPVRWVFGNHDVGMKVLPGKTGGTTGERTVQIEARLGPSFFLDVREGGRLRIIGINGSLMGSGLPREADQWAFLESVLSSKPPKGTTTIIVSHYPVFLTDPGEPGGDYWDMEPAPRQRLLRLMRKGGVRAFLSGHLHRPLRNRHDGIVYIGTLPVSFGLPRGQQPQGWTLVTLPANGDVTAEEHILKD